MEIIPLAFDSLGARSMCTFVKTKNLNVMIDPSVALGPKRYGLPPHELEIKKMAELMNEIRKALKTSDIVVITHYHYDHHNPDDAELLVGKKLLLKHPKEKINRSQAGRAAYFLERLKEAGVTDIDFADGKSYDFDGLHIAISKPVYHGAGPRLGYVIEVFLDDGDTFLFSSDVEGPIHKEQLEFMVERNAGTVFIDGPMTYMLGYRFSAKSLDSSIENLMELIDKTNVRKLIVDHHLTRDLNYKEKISQVIQRGEEAGTEVISAAEFLGREDLLLEARRKELYLKRS
ncbi:MAG: MBL fold metallo-hydrolase [Archaeoglobus sp.]|nr:MBL fold metallo-hydrolase [Archaeoglobus sp.]